VAAENPHVAFVVASAAGGVPTMSDMEVYSVSNYLRVREMEEPDRQLAERYARAIVATAFDGAPRAELEAVYQEVRDPPLGLSSPAGVECLLGVLPPYRLIRRIELLATGRRADAFRPRRS
jgi:hypothetical protein